MTPLLEIANLNAWYGTAHVLFGVSFEIEEGTLLALLGRNGAGKSTTCKSIVGVEAQAVGRIALAGAAIHSVSTARRARLGIQLVPEDRRVYAGLTVVDNLMLARAAAGLRKPLSLDRVLDVFPTLRPLLDRRGDQLSGGEQQLVAIARALVPQPRLLVLDEPSEGLSPVIVEQVGAAIQTVRTEFGTTVLLAEQNTGFALELADRVVVLDGGRVAFAGSRAELQRDPVMTQRFLSV